MTAPRVAVAETSLPRVRAYLDNAVSEALRSAAVAVRIVDRVRVYVDGLAATVDRCRTPGGCSTCVERRHIVMQLRGLLGDDTWRCAWCQAAVTSLPCTNPDCPGTRGRR